MTGPAAIASAPAGSEYVPLLDIARELQIVPGKLRALSQRGEFPALLKVTQKHYLVKRVDYENWKAGRWTTEAIARSEAMVEEPPAPEKRSRRRAPRKP